MCPALHFFPKYETNDYEPAIFGNIAHITKNVDQETMEKRKKTLIWSKISQKRLFTVHDNYKLQYPKKSHIKK